ncbi:MAG: histidine phosphatase family protein, partial [Okeania sp. SIO2H7]|nr:histidine phosphatase family protein [Okeania sp. SIO2H7]
LGIDLGRFRDRIAMPVGGVSIIEMGDRGPLMHSLGDRSYLEDSLRFLAGH